MRVAAVAAVAASLLAASAATAAAPSQPDPKQLVLAVSDFASAKVASQKGASVAGVHQYMRTFSAGSKLGGRALFSVVSSATLYDDRAGAEKDWKEVTAEFRTKKGRAGLAKALEREYGLGASSAGAKAKAASPKLRRVVVGPPVALGPDALRLAITFELSVGSLRMAIAAFRVERVIGAVDLIGLLGQKIDLRDVARSLAAMRARATAAFTVASSAPPAVSGTLARGEVLTAGTGDWAGSPTDFAYAWSRCDAGGTVCAPIEGATEAIYMPADADAGSTLRVTVTASNSVGSQQATSAPTSVVP